MTIFELAQIVNMEIKNGNAEKEVLVVTPENGDLLLAKPSQEDDTSIYFELLFKY